mmetsp:Transcript_6121/g.37984  ORF Transcript_6121/g.37984 Transcript_6121/m.37984 type:complete len:160 (-) Transcript_6121:2566-3045(-)
MWSSCGWLSRSFDWHRFSCMSAAPCPSSIACAAWSCGTASPLHATRKVQDLRVVCKFGNRDQVLSTRHNPDVKKGGAAETLFQCRTQGGQTKLVKGRGQFRIVQVLLPRHIFKLEKYIEAKMAALHKEALMQRGCLLRDTRSSTKKKTHSNVTTYSRSK